MKFREKINNVLIQAFSGKGTALTFLRFYAVGLVLFALPVTREFFIYLICPSLLFVIAVVFYQHRGWNIQTILCFVFIMVFSFLLEMAGTTTGKIFGSYFYEKGLGWQLNHTPLIIGLNWLFLVYASHDIARQITRKPVWRILLGAVLMVMYDMVMEWVAPVMKMWYFVQGYPPFQNFLTWFVAAAVFHSLMEILQIRTSNFSARVLFGIQVLFFVTISLIHLIFIR